MANSEDDAQPMESSVDARLVRELADVLNETGLTEIEVERGDLRVRLTKSPPPAPMALAPQMLAAAPAYAAAAPPSPQAAPAAVAAAVPAGEMVKSPMVGTVYLQPQPGAAPFVRVGDRIEEGQTLLLLEAMKTMNPIPAPKSGVLVEFLVADGQPVEYGEPLLVIG